jgi:hypothetical protein
MDETRITGRLPGLDIEIAHRTEPEAEILAISLRATPSFEAVLPLVQLAMLPALWWADTVRLGLAGFPLLPRR